MTGTVRTLPAPLRERGVTRREAEVLQALAEHLSNAEIAERLYISIRTVETHVSSLLAKLGAESRRELAAMDRSIQAHWAGATALPRPVILSLAEQGPFVGRVAELVRLRRAWKEASTGRGGVVLVAGEPGIGKSRLAAELAVEAHEEGAALLYGRCDEELRVIYQPFAQALGAYLDSRPAEQLQAQLGALGGELARVVPGLPARLPGLPEPLPVEPDTAQYRLFEAVRELLAGISRSAPVLLVLDDLHWAAKPALTLLRHVVRSCESLALLIVGTYRDANAVPGHPLADVLADLRRDPGIERLVLGGLGEADVTALVQALSPHIPDAAALGRAIHAHTEGNPFFVLELLRHLGDSATAACRSERFGTERGLLGLGVPEGAREFRPRPDTGGDLQPASHHPPPAAPPPRGAGSRTAARRRQPSRRARPPLRRGHSLRRAGPSVGLRSAGRRPGPGRSCLRGGGVPLRGCADRARGRRRFRPEPGLRPSHCPGRRPAPIGGSSPRGRARPSR